MNYNFTKTIKTDRKQKGQVCKLQTTGEIRQIELAIPVYQLTQTFSVGLQRVIYYKIDLNQLTLNNENTVGKNLSPFVSTLLIFQLNYCIFCRMLF